MQHDTQVLESAGVIEQLRAKLRNYRARNRNLRLILKATLNEWHMERYLARERIRRLESDLFDANLRADNWQGRYNMLAHQAVSSQQLAQAAQAAQAMQNAQNQLLAYRDCTCIPGRSSLLGGQ